MPFKRGVAPIRRTLNYLDKGQLVFKDRVKVMTVNFNEERRGMDKHVRLGHHSGAADFVFWNLPQIQHKNPKVQIVTFKNMTPSPFVTCYLDDGSGVVFDVDGQTNEDIVRRLQDTLGKSAETLRKEAVASEKRDNPANFGRDCDRYCICSQPGQLPCPGVVSVPKFWRGKYHYHNFEDDEEGTA